MQVIVAIQYNLKLVHVLTKSFMAYNTELVHVQCTYQVVDGIQHKTCPDHDGRWRSHQGDVIAIV